MQIFDEFVFFCQNLSESSPDRQQFTVSRAGDLTCRFWLSQHPEYHQICKSANTVTASAITPQRLFLEHEGWLRTVVRSRLKEPDAVEDVMQNIALAVVRHREMLSEVNRAGAWLYQIAVRQVLMYRRTTGRRRRFQDGLMNQATISNTTDNFGPLRTLLSTERQGKVREALETLPELDRQVLLLKYAEGWSYREMAAHLGVTEQTIEYRLMRARRQLRGQLNSLDLTKAEE